MQQHSSRRSHKHTPVVALLAELLLEVAQGETVALHAPPVGDFLTAEEVRHHRLAASHSEASRAFSHPGRRRRERDAETECAFVCACNNQQPLFKKKKKEEEAEKNRLKPKS